VRRSAPKIYRPSTVSSAVPKKSVAARREGLPSFRHWHQMPAAAKPSQEMPRYRAVALRATLAAMLFIVAAGGSSSAMVCREPNRGSRYIRS